MLVALGYFAFSGSVIPGSSANADSPPELMAGGELDTGTHDEVTKDAAVGHGAKIALGNNANAVLSLDLIADGGAGNRRDDGVTTGNVVGRGTKIAIEIFATGVTTSLRGVILRFDFDASLLAFVKAENSAFPLSIPAASVGVNLAATSPVALVPSGFLARAEFETVANVTGREFSIGIESVTLGESPTSSDVLSTGSEITFNAAASPDFDGDGTVGFTDFLLFAELFGTHRGDRRYQARIDLDGDGTIGFTDFLIFAEAFGSQVPPSGGGGTPSGSAPANQIAFDHLAVGKRILGKTFFLDVVSSGRFAEGFRRHRGRYTYTNTGPNTGNLTQIYDDSGLFGGRCVTEIRFATATSGTLRFTCDDGTEGEVESWRTTDLSVPVFARATSDTLYFELLDSWRAGETRAYDFQLRTKTPQGEWNQYCLTFTNPTDNTLSVYASVWFLGSDIEPGTTYEMRYRYRNSSSCDAGSPGPWSPVAEGATAGSGTSGGGGTGGNPDLIVESPSVDDNTLRTGQSFTLSATVRNRGDAASAPTTLRYYRSTNATISSDDTEVGTDTVDRLSASAASAESIVLTAPSSAGTYYYGACVESVSDESDTGNNCSASVSITVAVAPPPETGTSMLYWTDWGTNKIQRSALDGSGVEDVVSGAGLDGPDGLALDVSGGNIYWTDVGTDKIQRADLDGSNVDDLITSGLRVPYGLALDLSSGKMYWTNRETGKIQRADLDGSNVEDLLTLSVPAFPGELALDVSGGKMYWTNPGKDKIQRANLDGSNVEDLITSSLNSPTGLALDVSGGKAYWTDRVAHKIQRANLDGSNVEDLIASGLNTPTALDLDVSGGKMYWTEAGAKKVRRANLDGSNVEDLITSSNGLVDPSGLALGMIGRDTGNGGGGSGKPLVAVTNTRCSGTRQSPNSNRVLVTIQGTITALKTVISGTITGYANEQLVGVYDLSAMSPGQSVDFTITGSITTSESRLRCRTSWEVTGRRIGRQSGSIEE
ncbi:MAG: hypothetical protein OXR72_07260 [Gemmatimonadota bacterium]|nr:hypothetical protein [Gemmatimonadota bacterium]